MSSDYLAHDASHQENTVASSFQSPRLMSRGSPCPLLQLDEDVFDHICSFIPVDDLLFKFASVNREARRRTWGNHELWQKLWMRYLVQFFHSLIPPPDPPCTSSSSVSAGSAGTSPSPSVSWPVGVMADTTSMVSSTTSHNDAAWRLYHYHASKEVRPRVELLERLRVTLEDIADPPTEETPPTMTARTFAGSSGGGKTTTLYGGTKAQDQTLLFAQLCATQLLSNNLTHVTASPSALNYNETSPTQLATTSLAQKSAKKTAEVRRRRERQSERQRRALHFLLSADTCRPALLDRLWASTYEAGETYRRETEVEAATNVIHKRSRRRHMERVKSSLLPTTGKDQLRPLSWLDNRDVSVKVLLFDDNSRSVGDDESVQVERIKLLSAIAHHWRLAYAHQFYLTPTDGKDNGSFNTHPSTLPGTRMSRSWGRSRGGDESATATAAPETQIAEAQQTQQQQRDGRVSWEQIYRRFRDDSASVHSSRIPRSLRRVVVMGAAEGGGDGNGGRMSRSAAATPSERAHDTPSSGNPLFDLHLLTYGKRKQFYAAILASTVEMPDGMGAFFATCVSEPFLRWWCWRNRRLHEIAAAGYSVRDAYQSSFTHPSSVLPSTLNTSATPSSTAATFSNLPSTCGAVPATLCIACVCSVHMSQYGTTARDGSFGHLSPIEADESIVYSSSYSDVTTSTDTLVSDSSSSIEFVQEERVTADEEEENNPGTFQSYSGNGVDSNSGSNRREEDHRERQQQQCQHPKSPQSALSRPSAPRVALLFPLPHMLAYWFMMHHVTFYSYQVYRRLWGDQEITTAVCSRILSPTGHNVECRLFYTLRCAAFPRMYTKMMFTPGTLPALTLQNKMSARSPYRSPSTSSAFTTSSSSEEEHQNERRPPVWQFHSTHHINNPRDSDSNSSDEPAHERPTPLPTTTFIADRVPASPELSTSASSEPHRGKYTTLDSKPVDSRQVYDLFWVGFGRVEVESSPTISRSNLVRLRVALGLPVDFPMGLLWNLIMFASGVGPLILKDHRHSLFFSYSKSFTDVVEEEFGEVSCYGYGARPTLPPAEHLMSNPLDAEVELMRERPNLDEVAHAVVQGLAQTAISENNNNNHLSSEGEDLQDDDANDSFSTPEREDNIAEDNDDHERYAAASSSGSPTSSLTTSAPTYGSWGLDSEFSSMGSHSSWRDWLTPESESLWSPADRGR